MPRFAANLSTLWPELDPYDRFPAAAAAGFRQVEYLFPEQLDPDRLEAALRDNGLDLVLFDVAAGDLAAGDLGLLSLPGREPEFRAAIETGLALAHRLGTRTLNVLAGIPPAATDPATAWSTAVANLRTAAPMFESAGRTLVVEAINPTDRPGYLLADLHRAAALAREAHPAVRLQLDQYHAAMVGADPVALLREYGPLIAHVQIADVPGRHQPGTGTQPIAAFLAALHGAGYDGFVGLEYQPLGPTDGSFAWMA